MKTQRHGKIYMYWRTFGKNLIKILHQARSGDVPEKRDLTCPVNLKIRNYESLKIIKGGSMQFFVN